MDFQADFSIKSILNLHPCRKKPVGNGLRIKIGKSLLGQRFDQFFLKSLIESCNLLIVAQKLLLEDVFKESSLLASSTDRSERFLNLRC